MDLKKFTADITVNDNGCWISHYSPGDRYARIWHNGKHMLAHRYAWKIAFGEIPDDTCVLHHCDNPKCVNPDHLFLGTNQENVDDKMKKNRHGCSGGSRNSNAKLNISQVTKIKELLIGHIPQRKIAAIFHVSQRTIAKINLGLSYTEVL